jgi:transposase-like protein
MSLCTLSLSERRALAKQSQETHDVKVCQRAQALLGLSEGVSVREISQRLGSSRQTRYAWGSC